MADRRDVLDALRSARRCARLSARPLARPRAGRDRRVARRRLPCEGGRRLRGDRRRGRDRRSLEPLDDGALSGADRLDRAPRRGRANPPQARAARALRHAARLPARGRERARVARGGARADRRAALGRPRAADERRRAFRDRAGGCEPRDDGRGALSGRVAIEGGCQRARRRGLRRRSARFHAVLLVDHVVRQDGRTGELRGGLRVQGRVRRASRPHAAVSRQGDELGLLGQRRRGQRRNLSPAHGERGLRLDRARRGHVGAGAAARQPRRPDRGAQDAAAEPRRRLARGPDPALPRPRLAGRGARAGDGRAAGGARGARRALARAGVGARARQSRAGDADRARPARGRPSVSRRAGLGRRAPCAVVRRKPGDAARVRLSRARRRGRRAFLVAHRRRSRGGAARLARLGAARARVARRRAARADAARARLPARAARASRRQAARDRRDVPGLQHGARRGAVQEQSQGRSVQRRRARRGAVVCARARARARHRRGGRGHGRNDGRPAAQARRARDRGARIPVYGSVARFSAACARALRAARAVPDDRNLRRRQADRRAARAGRPL
ncbi:putative polyketide synthase [Burkholderia pseudomallei]|nr:putative polyketide synthase [Burkholderia pseudomallei]